MKLKNLKSILITAVVLSSSFFMHVTAISTTVLAEDEVTYRDIVLKEPESAVGEEDYYKDLLETEFYNFKMLKDLPMAYETECWESYCAMGNTIKNIDPEQISDLDKEILDNMAARRQELVQTAPAEAVMWYLWGEDMPCAEDLSLLEFTKEAYDNADFMPYLTPYLLEDQTNVKGNLIVVAGGGYSTRNNRGEGFPVCRAFNEYGYNCYLLQRRVAPYSPEDIWMDMQRSIRVVKYQIDQRQLGGGDCIMAAGFSGGSGTVLGAIANYYGDVQCTIVDSSYKPDEIDAINADLDVAFCIYGPNYTKGEGGEFQGLVTENENLPAMFLAAGFNDSTGAPEDNLILVNSVKDKTMVEYHTFANVAHGFGVGFEGTNSVYWIPMADNFAAQYMEEKAEEGK